jgi:hypothetical protein
VSVTVTNSSSLLRKFVAGRLTRSPAHFLHLVKHAPSRRRSAAPFAGKRRVRNVAITPRGKLHRRPGLVHAATVAKRQAPHPDRVRVAAASAALAAAECLRHGQWNSLDKG